MRESCNVPLLDFELCQGKQQQQFSKANVDAQGIRCLNVPEPVLANSAARQADQPTPHMFVPKVYQQCYGGPNEVLVAESTLLPSC